MKCPDCRGKGRIELFRTVKPCPACGGSGVAPEPPATFTYTAAGAMTPEQVLEYQGKVNGGAWQAVPLLDCDA